MTALHLILASNGRHDLGKLGQKMGHLTVNQLIGGRQSRQKQEFCEESEF